MARSDRKTQTHVVSPLAVIALIACVIIGFWIRGEAGLTSDEPFQHDSAFHHRMTLRALDGRLGETDGLRFHPEGARVTELQPTGLYTACSTFHRLIAPITGGLEGSIRVFNALAGSLIAVPLFFLGRRLWGSNAAALLAAAVITLLPAHAARTLGNVYRFDALGTLLWACHLMTVVEALAAQTERRRLTFTVIAALTLLMELAVWRAGVGLFAMEAAILAFLLVWTDRWSPNGWLAAALTAGFLAAGILPYFRGQHVLLSQTGIAGLVMAVATAVVGRVWPEGKAGRGVAVAILIIAVGVIGSRFVPATPFDVEEGSAIRSMLARNGIGEADPFLVNLYALVYELTSPGWALFTRGNIFSWSGPLAALGLIWMWRSSRQATASSKQRKGRVRARRAVAPTAMFMIVFGLISLTAAFFFDRSKAFASIPYALLSGGAACWAVSFSAPIARWLTAAALCVPLVACGRQSSRVARNYASGPDPGLIRIGRWVSENVPEDEPILADWGHGYYIQTSMQRPTFVDGHLEHPLNRTRIKAIHTALVDSDEGVLAGLCRDAGIRTYLLFQETQAMPFVYTGIITYRYGQSEAPRLPRSARSATVFRMFTQPQSIEAFELVHRDDPYWVYRLKP